LKKKIERKNKLVTLVRSIDMYLSVNLSYGWFKSQHQSTKKQSRDEGDG